MKKLLLILTMLVSVCGFATAAEPDAVRVKPVGGDAILLQFTANPQVAYTTTGVTITATGQDAVTLDFDEIEFIDFVDLGSVSEVEANTVTVRVTESALVIENAEEGSNLTIFSIDGKLLLNATIADTFSIDRSRFQKGVYIVKINKTTFKLVL